MSEFHDNAQQLGFDALLSDADTENRARQFERETGHLPATMDEALPYYAELLSEFDTAMREGDVEEVNRIGELSHKLALRLNNGAPGILASDDAPGCVLERETAAPFGAVPLWGQKGSFEIEVFKMRVRIAIDGLFGICSYHLFWPGFRAHAVDWDKPFLSHTGYRSFLGVAASPQAGYTPDRFATDAIAAYVEHTLDMKLESIGQRYRGGKD